MQIPIVSGIYTDEDSDFRTAYPRNLEPVPKQQGISNGYLRPAEGIVELSTGNPGADRGSVNWQDICYRVMGTSLVRVDENGVTTILGDVGGQEQVTMDYSFDLLAIASDNLFFYWDGGSLTQVTDPDLGPVIDFIWVDGYFMTTDGENLVVTELSDPTQVDPIKYGSSEVDPDPIIALLKIRNEPVALNRYSCEFYYNIGGSEFPFQRIDGAQLTRGVIGTHACAVFLEAVAFLGGGRKEPPSVWLGLNGKTQKIATREVDQILQQYTETQLSGVVFETRVEQGYNQLIIRLPDRALVYDAQASQELGSPAWFELSSALEGYAQYRATNRVWCYDKWIVGDTSTDSLGTFSDRVSSHWGEEVGWEFTTPIIYNEGNGAIIHELELVALTGRSALGDDPKMWTRYSTDGETYSDPHFISVGKQGERNKRLVWIGQGHLQNWRTQRFNGTSNAHASFARLEARIEQLAW